MLYQLLSLYLYGYAIAVSAARNTPGSEPNLPFSNFVLNPLDQANNTHETTYREMCTAAPTYFLGIANKNEDQVLVNLNADGGILALGDPLDPASRAERKELLKTSRERITALNEEKWNEIWQQLKPTLTGFPTHFLKDIAMPIIYNLQEKYKNYILAQYSQQYRNYANCGEYARVTAAIYYKLELSHHDIGTIQIFILDAGRSNHEFVVLNSGIKADSIKNNPAKVAKILSAVNKNAYLCDEYNTVQGSYEEVRDQNKVYGKNSIGKWFSLDIINMNQDIDLSTIPEKAHAFRAVVQEIYRKLDTLFLENINIPDMQKPNPKRK
jgi:hypothetical protein